MSPSSMVLVLVSAIWSGIPKLALFHPDAGLSFPLWGTRLDSRQAAKVPIEASSLDSFEVVVSCRKPERILKDGLDSLEGSFAETRKYKFRKPRLASGTWRATIDLQAIDRELGGALLQVVAKALPAWTDVPGPQALGVDSIWASKIYQVEPLGILLEKHADSVQGEASVFDPSTGAPVLDAVAVLRGGAIPKRIVQGIFEIPAGSEGALLVRRGHRFGWLRWGSRWGDQWARDQSSEQGLNVPMTRHPTPYGERSFRMTSSRSGNLVPFLDRRMYRPGDTLRLTWLLESIAPDAKKQVRLEVFSPDGIIARDSFVATNPGHGQWRMALPREPVAGLWKIDLASGQESGAVEFEVAPMRPGSHFTSLESSIDPRTCSIQARFAAIPKWGGIPTGIVRWNLSYRKQQLDLPRSMFAGFAGAMPMRTDGFRSPEAVDGGKTWTTGIRRDGFSETRVELPCYDRNWTEIEYDLRAEVVAPTATGAVESTRGSVRGGVEPFLDSTSSTASVELRPSARQPDGSPVDGVPMRLIVRAPFGDSILLDTSVSSGSRVRFPYRRIPSPPKNAQNDGWLKTIVHLEQDSSTRILVDCPITYGKDFDPGWSRGLPLEDQDAQNPSSNVLMETSTRAGQPSAPGRPILVETGNPIHVRWHMAQAGWALVQVVGPFGVLDRKWIQCPRGTATWDPVARPEWLGGIEVAVHRTVPAGIQGGEFRVESNRASYAIRHPKVRTEFAVETIPGEPGVLLLKARNPSEMEGSITLSAIDAEGGKSRSLESLVDPGNLGMAFSGRWFSSYAKPWEIHHQQEGINRFGRGWFTSDMRSGVWMPLEADDGGSFDEDAPLENDVTTGVEEHPAGPRPDPWVGPLQSFRPGLIEHRIPVPAGSRRVRIGARGKLGSSIFAFDTLIDIAPGFASHWSVPDVLAPGDTVDGSLFLSPGDSAELPELVLEGAACSMADLPNSVSIDSGPGLRFRLAAVGEGKATLILRSRKTHRHLASRDVAVSSGAIDSVFAASVKQILDTQPIRLVRRMDRVDSAFLVFETISEDSPRGWIERFLEWEAQRGTSSIPVSLYGIGLFLDGKDRKLVDARDQTTLRLAGWASQIERSSPLPSKDSVAWWNLLEAFAILHDAKARGFGLPSGSLARCDSVLRARLFGPDSGLFSALQRAVLLSISNQANDTSRLRRLTSAHPVDPTSCRLASGILSRRGLSDRAAVCPTVDFASRVGGHLDFCSMLRAAMLHLDSGNRAGELSEFACSQIGGRCHRNGDFWLYRALAASSTTCGISGDGPTLEWKTDSGNWTQRMGVESPLRIPLPANTRSVQIRWSALASRRWKASVIRWGRLSPADTSRAESGAKVQIDWSVDGKKVDPPSKVGLGSSIQCQITVANPTLASRPELRLRIRIPAGFELLASDYDGRTRRFLARSGSVEIPFDLQPAHTECFGFRFRASHPGKYRGGLVELVSGGEESVHSRIRVPPIEVLAHPSTDSEEVNR